MEAAGTWLLLGPHTVMTTICSRLRPVCGLVPIWHERHDRNFRASHPACSRPRISQQPSSDSPQHTLSATMSMTCKRLLQVHKKAQALVGFLSAQPEVQRRYAALQLASKLISQCEVQARIQPAAAVQHSRSAGHMVFAYDPDLPWLARVPGSQRVHHEALLTYTATPLSRAS